MGVGSEPISPVRDLQVMHSLSPGEAEPPLPALNCSHHGSASNNQGYSAPQPPQGHTELPALESHRSLLFEPVGSWKGEPCGEARGSGNLQAPLA